tara:strand:- start:984 stop:1253 length:270 start_codon:yes stop_codon:yes gene_type:complete
MHKDYIALKEKLEKGFSWPSVYLFKFIIPANNQKVALVEKEFGDTAQITSRESKNGKYISISIKEVMINPDEVIKKYQSLDSIEGIMSL